MGEMDHMWIIHQPLKHRSGWSHEKWPLHSAGGPWSPKICGWWKKRGINIARKIANYWPNLWWNRVPEMVLYLWPINLQSLINRRWIPVHVARSPMFTAGGLPNVATKNSQFLPRFTEYNPIAYMCVVLASFVFVWLDLWKNALNKSIINVSCSHIDG